MPSMSKFLAARRAAEEEFERGMNLIHLARAVHKDKPYLTARGQVSELVNYSPLSPSLVEAERAVEHARRLFPEDYPVVDRG